MFRALLVLLLLALAALPARAQERATLIADSLTLAGASTIVASGNVEVFYKGVSLQATRIAYDGTTGELVIEGPLILSDGAGTVILADQAQLSDDLTEGILTSARLVLNDRLQLAAAQVARLDGGRYTALDRVVASSCTICAGSSVPLWEIRARRVVHDTEAHQIYFDGAQLRFSGMPLITLPQLRVPDPTLTRATGFLIPSFRTTSALGTGLNLPYFIALGPSRDLTVTPFLSTGQAGNVTLRYRQAFATGLVEVTGGVAADSLTSDALRGYLSTNGSFTLPRDFTLSFDGIAVSDPAYLSDYGITGDDRLESTLQLARTRRNDDFLARLIGFQTIREGESGATIPALVGDLSFERRLSPAILGGEASFHLEGHSRYRPSTDGSDVNVDGIGDGRDLARLLLGADWRRSTVLAGGVELTALGEARLDHTAITQDDAFAGTDTRLYGAAAVELRWPLVRNAAPGRSEVLEPVLQLVAAPTDPDSQPNEDSVLVEFDEGNLFALNRFPGADTAEKGLRANLGVNYRLTAPGNWVLGATAGRVLRIEDLGQFSTASGLDGISSDWLLAWHVRQGEGLGVMNRLLLGETGGLTKGELFLDFERGRANVAAGYVYQIADLAEDRLEATSELALDTSYDVTPNWQAQLTGRYDLIAGRPTESAVGLAFLNECLSVDLSLSRRFTSSTSVRPTTDFGLKVELLGFGGSGSGGPSRVCRR